VVAMTVIVAIVAAIVVPVVVAPQDALTMV
jgi:hypothetical protein